MALAEIGVPRSSILRSLCILTRELVKAGRKGDNISSAANV